MSTPTVVLVHGAFADASGFGPVSDQLRQNEVPHVAFANPLRGLHADADALANFVASIDGPVLLVGHSYGGAVITQAAGALPNVHGLVYLAGFAIDAGESVLSSQEPFPPTSLGPVLRPTAHPAAGASGGPDLYVAAEQYPTVVAAGVPDDTAQFMALSQRPIAYAALSEPATAAAWRSLPTWYLIASEDRALAPEAQEFYSQRMAATTQTVPASHMAHLQHPDIVGELILTAIVALTGAAPTTAALD